MNTTDRTSSASAIRSETEPEPMLSMYNIHDSSLRIERRETEDLSLSPDPVPSMWSEAGSIATSRLSLPQTSSASNLRYSRVATPHTDSTIPQYLGRVTRNWEIFEARDVNESHPLYDTESLWRCLDDILDSIGVLPDDHKLEFATDTRFDPSRFPNLFGDSSLPQMKGNVLSLDDAEDIYAASREMLQAEAENALWIQEVYIAAIKHAIALSDNKQKLALRITGDMRAQERYVKPDRRGFQPPAAKTDMAIVFTDKVSQYGDFIDSRESWHSLNPVAQFPDQPFAICFQAKIMDIHKSNSELFIFHGACFSVFEALADEVGMKNIYPLPPLLCVSIVSSTWNFIAHTCDSQGRHSAWLFHRSLSTDSLLDVYKLMAALKVLISTAQGPHLNWIHRLISTDPYPANYEGSPAKSHEGDIAGSGEGDPARPTRSDASDPAGNEEIAVGNEGDLAESDEDNRTKSNEDELVIGRKRGRSDRDEIVAKKARSGRRKERAKERLHRLGLEKSL